MRKFLILTIIVLIISVIPTLHLSGEGNVKVIGYGPGGLNFYRPTDVKVFNDKVFILDSLHFRVVELDENFNFIRGFGGFGDSISSFVSPNSIYVDSEGLIYVCDTESGKIKIFKENGEFAGWFISFEGMKPTACAIDENQKLWVLDKTDGTIKVFSLYGDFKMKIGKEGEGKKQFKNPNDIIIKDEKVFILDSGNLRVQVLSTSGEYLYDFKLDYYPTHFTFDKDGNIWITGRESGKVEVFSPQGKHLKNIGDRWNSPSGVCPFKGAMLLASFEGDVVNLISHDGKTIKTVAEDVYSPTYFPQSVTLLSDGSIVVANSGTSSISLFDKDGNFVRKISEYGRAPGKLQYPLGVCVNKDDEIVVLDTGSHVVEIYDRDGKFLKTFGRYGGGKGRFIYPLSIATDSDNQHYVTDSTCRVQVFDKDGKFLYQFGGIGSGEGKFTKKGDFESEKFGITGIGPRGIAVSDEMNMVFICDTAGDRVEVFTKKGEFLRSFGEGILKNPVSIALIPSKEIAVLNEGGRIDFFSTEGEYTRSIGESGGPMSNFNEDEFSRDFYKKDTLKFLKPGGIFYNDGRLFVADTFNHRIQIITLDQLKVSPDRFEFGEVNRGEKIEFEFDVEGKKGRIETKEFISLSKYEFDGKERIKGVIDTSNLIEDKTYEEKIKIFSLSGYNEILITFSIKKDTTPPELKFSIPDGFVTNKKNIKVEGETEKGAKVFFEGKEIEVDRDGNFTIYIKLKEGMNVFEIKAVDESGNENKVFLSIVCDLTPPSLWVNLPLKYKVVDSRIKISGEVEKGSSLFVNGKKIEISKEGKFLVEVPLNFGYNRIEFKAVDKAGNENIVKRVVYRVERKEIILWIGRKEAEVNGETFKMDVSPFIKNGRTYVPVRFITESLGAYVFWDQRDKRVTFQLYDTVVEMWVGKVRYFVNNIPQTMDSPPILVPPGRVMIPIRFVSEGLGSEVLWDGREKKVTIIYPKNG